MKTTERFQQVIKEYLDDRAKWDSLFAANYAKESKSVSECCNYIINKVKATGRNGFADDEIFGMAVHFYDEDIDKKECQPVDCNVVINRHVELTEEEKAEARENARKEYEKEMLATMRRQNAKTKPAQSSSEKVSQLSLF